jgi:hypothetical protein
MANKYLCSDGTYVTQSQINNRYRWSKEKKYAGITTTLLCEGCQKETGNDNDHTIAQARCKVIGKTELIWNPKCYVWSCRKCHHEWENFKSGEWVRHKNVEERLRFLKEHDPEGFNVRITLTESSLKESLI